MNALKAFGIFLLVFLLVGWAPPISWADHDDHRERNGHHEDSERDNGHNDDIDRNHEDNDYISPVSNPTYAETCGACHFAYQPALLPSGSWANILAGLDDHFGVTVDVDSKDKDVIRDYLLANGAEKSSAKRSRKIMRSLGSSIPMRITEIPYIKEKHHDISNEVFARDSVGGFSNCVACHTTAENGIYDDDHVVIPQ